MVSDNMKELDRGTDPLADGGTDNPWKKYGPYHGWIPFFRAYGQGTTTLSVRDITHYAAGENNTFVAVAVLGPR